MNASAPLNVNAHEFNSGAEQFYRTTLRQRHLEEALEFLAKECIILDRELDSLDERMRKALLVILKGQEASRFVEVVKEDVLHERADIPTLKCLMNLILLNVYHKEATASHQIDNQRSCLDVTPVYRAV